MHFSLLGAESWPPGVCLKYVGGDQFGHVNMVTVRSLAPQEMTDVSVPMQSPVSPGMYQGQWRMCTATGLYYGGMCNYTNQILSNFFAFLAYLPETFSNKISEPFAPSVIILS